MATKVLREQRGEELLAVLSLFLFVPAQCYLIMTGELCDRKCKAAVDFVSAMKL